MCVGSPQPFFRLDCFIEMSNKTNQFNSNYLRLNIANLRKYKKDKNCHLITFSVSDKYSDSGIVASIILEKKNIFFQIKEFLIQQFSKII